MVFSANKYIKLLVERFASKLAVKIYHTKLSIKDVLPDGVRSHHQTLWGEKSYVLPYFCVDTQLLVYPLLQEDLLIVSLHKPDR